MSYAKSNDQSELDEAKAYRRKRQQMENFKMNEHDRIAQEFEQSVTFKMLERIDLLEHLTLEDKTAMKNAVNTVCDYLGEMSSEEFIYRSTQETAERLAKICMILASPLVPYLYLLGQEEKEKLLIDGLGEAFKNSLTAGLTGMKKGKSNV